MKPEINLVIVGHIDHGKSTLIGRLLYDSGAIKPDKLEEVKMESGGLDFAHFLDNLEEEREGGLTIDTIQTPFESEKYQYSIIDCPGHKEFLKNMLTGASQADAAILVCSAKEGEGIQEQTKRHMFLVNLLGIKQVFVVINKMDTVDYKKEVFDKIVSGLKEFLSGLGYSSENMVFVPISAKKGDNVFKKTSNMSWYKGPAIMNAIDNNIILQEPSYNKQFRMPVQDVYDVDGEKTLVGKIESGTLEKKDVLFLPSNINAKVKKIRILGKELEKAVAGESIGIVVDAEGIKRGEVCCYPDEKPKIGKEFSAEIVLITEDDFIDIEDELFIRCGTADRKCKIKEINQRISSESGEVIEKNGKKIMQNEAGIVTLLAEQEFAADRFSDIPPLGRFILMKKGKIIGAGIILDIIS